MKTTIIWGAGHIGWSSACHLAAQGDRVLCVDTDPRKVVAINAGECPVRGLAGWMGGVSATPRAEAFGTGADAAAVCVSAELVAAIHHVAVPTERDAAPYATALYEVCAQIALYFNARAVVIIESTVAPSWLANVQVLHPGLRLVAAPRRDWFDDPEKHLGALARVVGSNDPEALALAEDHLRRISPHLVRAPSLALAALVKAVENDLRFVCIAWANDLARTLGRSVDVREVLRLASTKFNIDLYQPGIGVSGPCLPLAGQYLALEQAQPAISRAARDEETRHRSTFVQMLRAHAPVGFLGIGYKAPAPYTPACTAVWIARDLVQITQASVVVFPDDDDQMKAAAGLRADIGAFPADAERCKSLVIPCATARAKTLRPEDVARFDLVLDHEAALSPEARAACRRYVLPGERGWMNP